jgi:hypothetical protein
VEAQWPLQSLPALLYSFLPRAFHAQKTAARGLPPAATGFDFYRILSTWNLHY